MTIDELNALYEATDFGNNANYKAPSFDGEFKEKILPVDTSIPGLPIVQQLGKPYDDNDGGIKALAGIDYGYDSVFNNTNITPTRPDGTLQPQTNFEYDIGEGTIPQEDIDNNKTSGIAGLLELLQKISPMGMIYKAGNNIITNTQKYFADKKETERLEVLAQIEQAKKQKEAQEQIRNAEEAAFAAAGGNRAAQEAQRRADAATIAQANRDYSSGASYSGGESTPGDDTSYNDPFDPGGGEKDGGHIDGTNRRRYGMGGIVSL